MKKLTSDDVGCHVKASLTHGCHGLATNLYERFQIFKPHVIKICFYIRVV